MSKDNRILLVEDTPANIQTVTAILKEQGYQISVATNGKLALEAVGRQRPDLILLDVMMPEMDGFETCRLLKANPEWRNIPVIFLTAKTETEDIVRGFELGAVDYVAKPFNAHELLARVNTHLSLDRLNRENTRLLLNILPGPIADRLKREEGVIAERFEDASVLFADLVDFTPLSSTLSAIDLVQLLNRIFTGFDGMVERYGLEKIKTIGDAYMVAGGLPEPSAGHLGAMARLALDMQGAIAGLCGSGGPCLRLRVGLHVGDVVAGVIGRRKFIYDIWGDTVNIASRLESHGQPGKIHVSELAKERLGDHFTFEPRGTIQLKGKGEMATWFLAGAAEGV
jgi:class 3 adenylate cyclase